MRTTSFCKAAYAAALWCCAATGFAVAGVPDAAPVQDLGVSEVSGDDGYKPTTSANYTEITSDAWEGDGAMLWVSLITIMAPEPNMVFMEARHS